MKRLLLLINLLVCFAATSQTTFVRGDIMVLGVNTHNPDNICNPSTNSFTNHYDNIHFVSFSNISNGDTFDITDNRYNNGNSYANTEGYIRFVRVGGNIPAGQVFKIDIPGTQSIGNIYNGWRVELKTGSFGLNNGGDQFFILQDGTWSSGNYTNGSQILAYNSKRTWNSGSGSENSNLPSQLSCYHISSPVNINLRYRYYNGNTTEVISHGEWLVKILNGSNWMNTLTDDAQYWIGCGQFANNVFSGTLPIRTIIPSQEICVNESLTALEVVNETNVVTYQWYRNTSATTTGTPVPVGTNSFSYTPSNTLVGTYYYYCVMTIDLPLNGTSYPSCPFNSGFFKVTINPNPITSPVIPL